MTLSVFPNTPEKHLKASSGHHGTGLDCVCSVHPSARECMWESKHRALEEQNRVALPQPMPSQAFGPDLQRSSDFHCTRAALFIRESGKVVKPRARIAGPVPEAWRLRDHLAEVGKWSLVNSGGSHARKNHQDFFENGHARVPRNRCFLHLVSARWCNPYRSHQFGFGRRHWWHKPDMRGHPIQTGAAKASLVGPRHFRIY